MRKTIVFYLLLVTYYGCFLIGSELLPVLPQNDMHTVNEQPPPKIVEENLKKVVYTCICGDYDSLIHHYYVQGDWDYVCFTDNPKFLENGHDLWEIRPLEYTARDNTRNARWHKILTHKILPEYDISLYVDGNIDIIASDIFDYIDHELISNEEHILAVHAHPKRDCIYQEAIECKKYTLDNPLVIDTQVSIIKNLNYPECNGLQESNILYRRHHNEQLHEVVEGWWWWVSNYSRRDQLSFNFLIWKHDFKIHVFQKKFSNDYGCIRVRKHAVKR